MQDSRSLQELVTQVISPGVLRADVDDLLRGLGRPLAQGESPRFRADILISLLESNRVSGMKGSTGQHVHAAALEALLNLGHPYPLELSPSALARARRKRGLLQQDTPVAGLVLVLVGALFLMTAVPAALVRLRPCRRSHPASKPRLVVSSTVARQR